ncbi:DNA replication licensing factor mcm10 [Mycena venus]|uniref:DNA replication licensing factor mcm10 n=1 Tax=Mycena venus TaxID=2733690 RepID=A0A8H6U1L4_9AGAR|nr:DNA replication licensing factor mcm10 [Mycena venus]
MESFAAKERMERERKAELKRQIAALQAQLPDSDPESPSRAGPSSPKRRKLDAGAVLAPPTPSPKKTRRPDTTSASYANSRHALKSLNFPAKKPADEFVPTKPAASTLLSKLANVNRQPMDTVEAEPLVRSSAFTDAPQAPSASVSSAPQRDDRLTIIENLEVGPVDHNPPFDDPHFQQLEPNSGIRLSSRVVPHEDLQDHLRGRYYLSPSRLYSAVRLLPDKQGYDVPVAGDWITIAVVAERGPYKYSKAPAAKGKAAKDPPKPKPSGKKFINIKLVDFGATARSALSATGGKAVIRGDALLSLLLFESDGFETVPPGRGPAKERRATLWPCSTRGSSNPFQRSNDTPHPTTNILAITPESASSILVIGRAKDLGLCVAVKRDGKVCKAWCDRRVSDVCEWHVQHAVEQRRASRPEFASGTSGMSTTARKKQPEYDPRRKVRARLGGATYVVAGHIVNAGRGDPRDSLFVAEHMGREGQAKASRKLAAREDARVLKALSGRDAEGMKAVLKAREVALAEKDKEKAGATPDAKAMPAKSAFSPQVIKNLGFDPTHKSGQRRHDNVATQKKLEDLALLQSSRKPIVLGGEKLRSSVVVPSLKPKPKKNPVDMHELSAASVSLSKPASAQPDPDPAGCKDGRFG